MNVKLVVLTALFVSAIAHGQGPAVIGGGYRIPSILAVAPGQVITLFVTGAGKHLSSTPLRFSDGSGSLPLTLGGISAVLHQSDTPTSVAAPILGAVLSDTCQSLRNTPCDGLTFAAITVQIPFELAVASNISDPSQRSEALLTVQEDGVTSADFLVAAVGSNIHFVTGAGPLALDYIHFPYIHGAAVVHADGSPVAPGLPARVGETVVVFGYGFGRPSKPVKTGAFAEEANPVPLLGDVKFSSLLSESPGADPGSGRDLFGYIDYVGLSPNSVGLYQLNFRVPPVPATIQPCIGTVDWNFVVSATSAVSTESFAFCVQP